MDANNAKNAFDILNYEKEGIIDIEEVLNNMVNLRYDNIHPRNI